ncbi:DUF6468 domain-containing protein [Methylobacterium organophilum]|uniref:DUF6468 domain-containing protein n=1 Tax=Methylobacterium organophilum TaxID=410 RepID=UPI001F12DD5E|nr:DUF6468 domain-containing protein [Methylobacterium organophilum]UMY15868.1 DUF6468 domain-containing protein [Methylobacterium organophilum]
MTLFVSLAADILVAILLVATIATSLKLSRRITTLKADEAAMRQTIGDLVVASATAERAITGLRATLDDCDRTLAERLAAAERGSAELAAQVRAGEQVVARIGAIVANARAASAAEAAPARIVEPMPEAAGNGERLGAALAAAQALSERALDRLRARAA